MLDLYELYNLVVARGGLVEVINKKQWQEIIKGLGLPSSITSAAFTLRTQYTKYLYPLECKIVNLSNPSDLQSAIEGNKREGRTSSYGPYGGMGHLPFQVRRQGGEIKRKGRRRMDLIAYFQLIAGLPELPPTTLPGRDAPLLHDEHPPAPTTHERQPPINAPRYEEDVIILPLPTRYQISSLDSDTTTTRYQVSCLSSGGARYLAGPSARQ